AAGGNGGGGGERRSQYRLLVREHLVGTVLLVFVRTALLPNLSDVRTATVSAGALGVMGNKGAVGVRFDAWDTSLCFVCTHLAAHRENVRARNDNYHKIMRSMIF
ncbi:unnamed protein product, partial [Phaeothamnion confervicola]